ncbi:MAG: response regulator, partial [Pricia sp.]|nr:response regulator [Pricia sp.]
LEVDKLFTRFYQQDEFSEGAGIGLSLVKQVVQLYQGEITAEIEDENIIHFQVRLPVVSEYFRKSEFSTTYEETSTPIGHDNTDSSLNSSEHSIVDHDQQNLPLLLIVEDHKEVREFLKSVWGKKYRLEEAKNGKEGMEKALEIVPDLVITDIRMPICDGIELCNLLKTDERTSHIPIILLTAGTDEEQELKGLRSGADDFVTKPFNLRILETRVENLIKSRKRLRNRYSQEMMLQAKDIAVTPTDEIFLKRLQKVLDEQLANSEFNAAIFCKALGMSRMQLHRKLQAYTGLSTTEFIRSQRLKQAITILETSNVTVNEVAYTVGFNTPSYFIKCFKEAYDKTP